MCQTEKFWAEKVELNDQFHINCRKSFINKHYIKPFSLSIDDAESSKATTRASSMGTNSVKKFDYRSCCLFCCEETCE